MSDVRRFSSCEQRLDIQFAPSFPDEAIVVTLSQQLSWSGFHVLNVIHDGRPHAVRVPHVRPALHQEAA